MSTTAAKLGLSFFRCGEDPKQEARNLYHCSENLADDRNGRDRRNGDVERNKGQGFAQLLGVRGLREAHIRKKPCWTVLRDPGNP
jgi:hypothetical protein